MSNLFETAIVEKRNVLNELRSNNMTLQELRFFSIYLSKINPWNKASRVVRFPIEDFQRIMGFGKLNISQLRASTDSLLCKLVHIPDEDGRGMRSFQLFKECHLFQDDHNKWFMEIDAHDKALPLMFDFKNRYFQYELWNALRLKSPNQMRMYEILKQYENIGWRELTVKDLRELLGIDKAEYTYWQNFKVRVLDSCQQALEEITDICYTYERGKTGKGGKWVTIIFHIKKNTAYKDQLSLDEFIDLQPEPEMPGSDFPIESSLSINSEADLNDHSYEKTTIDPEEERSRSDIAFCNSACDDEFSENEIVSLMTLLNSMELPEHDLGKLFAKYHYLLEQYSKFKAVADHTKIANRFRYFYAMIENERDKQLTYT